MTTKDIEKIFGISNYQPPRELSGDKEILEFIGACKKLSDNFEKIYNDSSEEDMTSSHSETEIYNGCVSLMWQLVGRFYDYLEYLGVEIADDMKFGTTFYPTSIVERLFLWKTSHSGGTSQRMKCKELGIDTREITFDFSEFENEEDE